ncbi:hypothetical protein BGZ60DRAFT_534248 [Tricladium varicosporioides]|nr:hypothetical protein BGZ60DRAFT_534248 [Hymenoscyphus varicosporioides]
MPGHEGPSELQQVSQTSFLSDSSPGSLKNESPNEDTKSLHTETSDVRGTTPENWPTGPIVAGDMGWGQRWEVIGNALLVAGSFFFLVFAFLSAHGHHLPCGMQKIAHFADLTIPNSTLEGKTEEIWVLELLIGSRSLASVATTVISLRNIHTVGIVVAVLWCLSPLGGQASLRIVGVSNSTESSLEMPWSVVNTTSLDAQTVGNINHDDHLGVQTTYLEALSNFLKKEDHFPLDVQQNPLVVATQNNYSWTLPLRMAPKAPGMKGNPTNWSGYDVNFTSLIGLKVKRPSWMPVARPKHTSVNLTFPISLYQFDCSSVNTYPINSSWKDLLAVKYVTDNGEALDTSTNRGSGFFVEAKFTNNSQQSHPQSFLFGSFHKPQITIWNCSIAMITQTITLECGTWTTLFGSKDDGAKYGCFLRKMEAFRKSFSTPLSNVNLTNRVMREWHEIDEASSKCSSVTEKYLTEGIALKSRYNNGIVDLSLVDGKTFSARLTTAFNTIWLAYVYLAGDTSYMNTTKTTPTPLPSNPILVCNWIYFTILVATSIFMIFCGVLCTWLSYHITSPDIMGYVSSMTIENPYFNIPGTKQGSGSAMDGLQRTRLLRGTRVRLGDVQNGEAVGKFGFATEDQYVVRAKKGREFM